MKTQQTLAEDRAFLNDMEQWINTQEDHDLLIGHIAEIERRLRAAAEVAA